MLDADDTWHRERLARLLALAEAQEANIVADNILLCDGAAERPMIPAHLLSTPRRLGAAEFVARNVTRRRRARTSFGFLQPVFRRDFLLQHGLRYDERNRFGEDYLFALACLLRGANWWLWPEPLYRYRVRRGTATEVQTVGDLRRIRAIESALLSDPTVARDRALSAALRRHRRIIDRCYYYRAFTDAVKGGAFREATRLLLESPGSLWHILGESLVQAPTIGAKALRGGYRARPVEQPRI